MCIESKHRRPRISLWRIRVYKVLIKQNDSYYTPYRAFEVKLNKLYKNYEEKDVSIFDSHAFVGGGFYHAYLNHTNAKITKEELRWIRGIKTGLSQSIIIVKGYIPMFTKYYKGRQSIAARKIKYIEEINI